MVAHRTQTESQQQRGHRRSPLVGHLMGRTNATSLSLCCVIAVRRIQNTRGIGGRLNTIRLAGLICGALLRRGSHRERDSPPRTKANDPRLAVRGWKCSRGRPESRRENGQERTERWSSTAQDERISWKSYVVGGGFLRNASVALRAVRMQQFSEDGRYWLAILAQEPRWKTGWSAVSRTWERCFESYGITHFRIMSHYGFVIGDGIQFIATAPMVSSASGGRARLKISRASDHVALFTLWSELVVE